MQLSTPAMYVLAAIQAQRDLLSLLCPRGRLRKRMLRYTLYKLRRHGLIEQVGEHAVRKHYLEAEYRITERGVHALTTGQYEPH